MLKKFYHLRCAVFIKVLQSFLILSAYMGRRTIPWISFNTTSSVILSFMLRITCQFCKATSIVCEVSNFKQWGNGWYIHKAHLLIGIKFIWSWFVDPCSHKDPNLFLGIPGTLYNLPRTWIDIWCICVLVSREKKHMIKSAEHEQASLTKW